jgi:hypothetical protein
MTTRIPFRAAALQQQPRRPANRQQQQSSGSGDFQPPRSRPMAQPQPSLASARERPVWGRFNEAL